MLCGFESCSCWWPSIHFPQASISALTYIQKHHPLYAPGQFDEYARKHLFAELWTKKLKWPHYFRANGIPWPSGPTQWSSSHSLHCWTEDKLCTWPQIIRPQMASCDGKGDPESPIYEKSSPKWSYSSVIVGKEVTCTVRFLLQTLKKKSVKCWSLSSNIIPYVGLQLLKLTSWTHHECLKHNFPSEMCTLYSVACLWIKHLTVHNHYVNVYIHQ